MEENRCSCGASPCRNCEECRKKDENKDKDKDEDNLSKFKTKIFYDGNELIKFVTSQKQNLKETNFQR
jgi:hypothetical protein